MFFFFFICWVFFFRKVLCRMPLSWRAELNTAGTHCYLLQWGSGHTWNPLWWGSACLVFCIMPNTRYFHLGKTQDGSIDLSRSFISWRQGSEGKSTTHTWKVPVLTDGAVTALGIHSVSALNTALGIPEVLSAIQNMLPMYHTLK